MILKSQAATGNVVRFLLQANMYECKCKTTFNNCCSWICDFQPPNWVVHEAIPEWKLLIASPLQSFLPVSTTSDTTGARFAPQIRPHQITLLFTKWMPPKAHKFSICVLPSAANFAHSGHENPLSRTPSLLPCIRHVSLHDCGASIVKPLCFSQSVF